MPPKNKSTTSAAPSASVTSKGNESAVLNSSKISSDVAKATAKYKTMKEKFRSLLLALKAQHAAMIDLNEKRLKTVQQYEWFVTDTPLEPLALKVLAVSGNVPNVSVESGRNGADDTDKNAIEEEDSVEHVDEKNEETSASKINASAKTSATKSSFTSLHRSVYDLNKAHQKRFAKMIEYAEEWINTVSFRVEANLVQFEDLKENLKHYSEKVNSLLKEKSAGSKASEKLSRNQGKLRGTREAHDASGQSLFLQLDEVTSRAWKDFYPLLVKAFDFDVNCSASEAKIFSDLEKMLPKLLEIGTEHDLEVSGRLEDLEKCQPWEFYTGDLDVSRVKKAMKTKGSPELANTTSQ